MSQTSPTPMTPLGTPPSTASPANFDSRADSFLGQLQLFQTEFNNLSTVNYGNAVDAYNSALSAASNAASAAANAASILGATGAAIWVSGTTYAIGDVRWAPADGQIYRRITSGAGTTDPSLDATNWMSLAVSAVGSDLFNNALYGAFQ